MQDPISNMKRSLSVERRDHCHDTATRMSSPHSQISLDCENSFFRSRFDLVRNCVVGGPSTPQDLKRASLSEYSSLDQQENPLRGNEVSRQSLSASLANAIPCTPRIILPLARLNVHTFLGMESIEQRWAVMEDRILILLEGRLEYLDLFRNLYGDGVRNPALLESVAYLSTPRKRLMENDEAHLYFLHISTVASYISVGRANKELKAAVLYTIVSCLSPEEAQWQVSDSVVATTLDFVTQRSIQDWEYMDHTETMLIWDLRALSLCLLDRKHEWAIFLAKYADTAAMAISTGAKLVEEGVSRSGATLSSHIEYVGLQMKDHIQANEHPILTDRDAVVALTFANAVKRVSVGAKESTRVAMESIRDVSARGVHAGVHAISTKIGEGATGDGLSAECRETLRAAGKVSVATVGAAAIVGEALLETSRKLMEKTASVTADVVQHRYGTSAGKVASDAGETAVNIVRALGNVAVVTGGAASLATVAAKENAKLQTASDAEKGRETLKMIEEKVKSFLKSALGNDNTTLGPKQLGTSRTTPT